MVDDATVVLGVVMAEIDSLTLHTYEYILYVLIVIDVAP